MYLDDRFCLREPLLETLVFFLCRLQLGRQGGYLRSGLLAAYQHTLAALLAPLRELRSVEPFPAKQRTDVFALFAGIGFLQNPKLVRCRESTPTGPRNYFRGRSVDCPVGL